MDELYCRCGEGSRPYYGSSIVYEAVGEVKEAMLDVSNAKPPVIARDDWPTVQKHAQFISIAARSGQSFWNNPQCYFLRLAPGNMLIS